MVVRESSAAGPGNAIRAAMAGRPTLAPEATQGTAGILTGNIASAVAGSPARQVDNYAPTRMRPSLHRH